MAEENNSLVVDGIRFSNQEDAELAKIDLEKIRTLEGRIDYKNSEMVKTVYDRAIMNKTFKTPVGFRYLLTIRDALIGQGFYKEEELKPVPILVKFAGNSSAKERADKEFKRKLLQMEERREKKKNAFLISVVMNVVLVILVIALYVITMYSDNPNILNYKRQITNQYSSWDQELNERERTVRIKEKELGITINVEDLDEP